MERKAATKKLVIVKGKGTPAETRTVTGIDMYPVRRGGKVVWVTVPED